MGRLGPVNLVNHTSWVAVATPTDHPKQKRSTEGCSKFKSPETRQVQERFVSTSNFFVALFVLSLCPFDISVCVGAFVIGLGQISSFLSLLFILVHLLHYILKRNHFGMTIVWIFVKIISYPNEE